MNLHRTGKLAEWETIPAEKRTRIQKLAYKTKGIITPPNLITILGLGLVIYGLILLVQEQYWIGLALLVVGRLLDIADGLAAEATKTKSPLGELFDATADKIGTILTIIALFVGAFTFWWILVALFLPQAIIAIVSIVKRRQNKPVHPTLAGKLSMATLWAALVGFILAAALQSGMFGALSLLSYIAAGWSTVLAITALWQYSTGKDQD